MHRRKKQKHNNKGEEEFLQEEVIRCLPTVVLRIVHDYAQSRELLDFLFQGLDYPLQYATEANTTIVVDDDGCHTMTKENGSYEQLWRSTEERLSWERTVFSSIDKDIPLWSWQAALTTIMSEKSTFRVEVESCNHGITSAEMLHILHIDTMVECDPDSNIWVGAFKQHRTVVSPTRHKLLVHSTVAPDSVVFQLGVRWYMRQHLICAAAERILTMLYAF